MYHACHDICTFSPLDTAAPMRFANNAQHRTSNVLRRPQKTHGYLKVLHLPQKMPIILRRAF
jgi:hypothetical protein